MKKQIVIIHGGMTFKTHEAYMEYLNAAVLTPERIQFKDWKESLVNKLPKYQVLYPKMPNSKNSRYLEWKIWFEKMIPFIEDRVVLIGHSLGGIFIAKYLSENNFPRIISEAHLVAAPYDDKDCDETLADFALEKSLNNFSRQVEKIYLYQSRDDKDVPFVDLAKYKKELPEAKEFVFEDRGHFIQIEFPELVENIKKSN